MARRINSLIAGVAGLMICFSPSLAQNAAHPAVVLSEHLMKPHMSTQFWWQHILSNEGDTPPAYPCQEKTLPVVRQFMLASLMQKQEDPAFLNELAQQLNGRFNAEQLGLMIRYFEATEADEDPETALPIDSIAAVQQDIQRASQMYARLSTRMQRSVMRETRDKLGQIIAAYATPDGRCKN